MIGTVKSCICPKCVDCCERNPGWFNPLEARAAIQAGHAGLMMRDWVDRDKERGVKRRIYVLSPASEGHCGKNAPGYTDPDLEKRMEADDVTQEEMFEMLTGSMAILEMAVSGKGKGRCVFLNDGLCRIHNSGFKPEQCRAALHGGQGVDNFKSAKAWNTPLGRAVIEEWQKVIGQ